MWQLLGPFFERQLAHDFCRIFCPFLYEAAWNFDAMAGTQATILYFEDKGQPKGYGELNGAWVSQEFVEPDHNINSGLPTSTLLCVREINSLL